LQFELDPSIEVAVEQEVQATGSSVSEIVDRAMRLYLHVSEETVLSRFLLVFVRPDVPDRLFLTSVSLTAEYVLPTSEESTANFSVSHPVEYFRTRPLD
jgi:hypothetical protein